jgi:RHS repeat-associated protein
MQRLMSLLARFRPGRAAVLGGVCLIVLALAPCQIQAQDPPSTDGLGVVAPASITPGAPAGSYILHDFDHINLAIRHLSIFLPLAPSMGRGQAKLSIGLSLDTPVWRFPGGPPSQPTGCDTGGGGGCTYGPATYTATNVPDVTPPNIVGATLIYRANGAGCQYESSTSPESNVPVVWNEWWNSTMSTITLSEADGTQMQFIDQMTGGEALPGVGSYGGEHGTNRGTTWVTHDGSAAILQVDAGSQLYDPPGCGMVPPESISGTVTFRDGTVYRFDNGWLSWVRDRNGNQVTLTGHLPSSFSVQDSLGRTTNFPASGSTILTYQGSNGATRTVSWVTPTGGYLNGLRVDWQAAVLNGTTYGNCPGATAPLPCLQAMFDVQGLSEGADNFFPTTATQVQLPNGTTYNIQYDIYGNVARIELPTGGAYEYDYDYITECHTPSNGYCTYTMPPLLKEKRVYADKNADRTTGWVQRITFSGWNGYQDLNQELVNEATIVQYYVPASTANATGVLAGTEYHYFNHTLDNTGGNNNFLDAWNDNKETEDQYYDVDGVTLLKTTTNTWDQRPCGSPDRIPCAWLQTGYGQNLEGIGAPAHDPQLTGETVQYGSEVAGSSYGYDSYNNRISEAEYGYGSGAPGALVRTTVTTYNAGSAYVSANLLGLPLVKSVTDGSGNLIAQTAYNYDETTPQANSGMIQYQAPATSARGNATSIVQWLHDPLGIQNPTTLTRQLQYDVAGNVIQSVDQRGVCTQRNYADSGNTYALPTTVTVYTGLNCTGTPMSLNTVYDYNIGRPTSATDPNGQTTTYDFTDPLDRLKQITPPIPGAWTKFTYIDTVGALSLTTQVAQSSGNPITTAVDYDGLGRKTRSIRYSACAGGGDVHVDTSYDGRGRVYQVSEPYCPGDALNYTTTLYDGMSRPTSVTSPGFATTTTAYGTSSLGQTTTVTSPAMVAGAAGAITRQSTTDGLGRLVQVIEDPAGLDYQTNYSYDGLDELIGVNQSGLTRSFAYDSLKRLRQATNPESGTITYSYDQSGNLSTKVDALSKTTTLSYDWLNRIAQKQYSDGTPTVTYTYDAGNATNCAASNGCTRLYQVAAGSNSSTYSLYDAVGHVKTSSQTTGGTNYGPFQYGWDVSGALASETYPSGRTLTNGFDGAGQINQVQGTLGAATTNYASNVKYAAQGAVLSLGLGNGIAETWLFGTPELQPTQLAATGAHASLTLGWTYGSESYNNGNIQTAAITGAVSTSQAFTYDSLNRLSGASEGPSPATTGNWTRNYGYDAFGNGWVTTWTVNGNPVAPDPTTPTAQSNFNSQNQLIVDGAAYNAAGNQTAIAGYTNVYDAENRLVTSTISGVTTTYTYDGDGRRVQKSNPSGTTTYVYDAAGQLAAEYGGATTLWATSYLTTDHLGSTRMVTDGTGTVKSLHDFLPFGEEIPAGTPTARLARYYPATPLAMNDGLTEKFTGKERDVETGLDYFGARYLSTAQGRFSSPDDPLADQWQSDPQSWNLYGYVRNSPLVNIDPSGQDCITTSSVSSSSVTVTTSPGGSAETCGGRYVNGTVDQSSFKYDGNTLTWSDNSEEGGGAMTFVRGSAPDQISPYGESVVHDLAQRSLVTGPFVEWLGWNLITFMTAAASQSDETPQDYGSDLNPDLPSTGRTQPMNVKEQLAMKQVKANPKAGAPTPLQMKDPRWPASEGWVKMRQNVNGVEVHYLRNTRTGELADFKFKD